MASSAVLMKPISPHLSNSSHYSPIFSSTKMPSSLSDSLQSLLKNPVRFIPEGPQKRSKTTITPARSEDRPREKSPKKRRLSSSSDESLSKRAKSLKQSKSALEILRKSRDGKQRRESKSPAKDDVIPEKRKKKSEAKSSARKPEAFSFEDYMKATLNKAEALTETSKDLKPTLQSAKQTAAALTVDAGVAITNGPETSPDRSTTQLAADLKGLPARKMKKSKLLSEPSSEIAGESISSRNSKKKRKHATPEFESEKKTGGDLSDSKSKSKSKETTGRLGAVDLETLRKDKKKARKERKAKARAARRAAKTELAKALSVESKSRAEKTERAPSSPPASPKKQVKEVRPEAKAKALVPIKKTKPVTNEFLLNIDVPEIPAVFRFEKDLPAKFDIKRAWTKLPANILPNGQRFTSGSHNPSMFCYMNSALQTLAHCPQAVFYLAYYHLPSQCPVRPGAKTFEKLKNGYKPCMTCVVRKFVMRSYDGTKRSSRDDYKLLEQVGQILGGDFARSPRSHRQADAGEALSLILQRCTDQHKAYVGGDSSPLDRIFTWRVGHTIKCARCNHVSKTNNKANLRVVTVPFDKSERSIDFSKICNKLSQDTVEGWKCENCKKESKGLKSERIFKLPYFGLINLSREVRPGRWGMAESRRPVACSTTETLKDSTGAEATFDLTSAAVHMGSFRGGHWVHFGRQPSGKWVCHSDDSVREQRVNGQLAFNKSQMISLIGLSRNP